MGVVISNYVDVHQRAQELGLDLASDFAILPRAFGENAQVSHLAHESEAATLRKLLKAEGIDIQQIEPCDGRIPSVVQRSADWLAPTIFIGSTLFTQNPYAIQVALNILASLVYDCLKGRLLASEMKLTFVVEQSKSKKCCRVDYEGPADALNELADLLREVHDELR
jgi:hypothetical protein